jgi:hydrogenase-4 component E
VHLALITICIVLVKGGLIPYFISNAVKKARIRREMEPFLGYLPSLMAGAIFTALAFLFAEQLPLAAEHRDLIVVPASIATIASGFLLITTRKKAISQVLGYLVLENGIFIFGLLLGEVMPFMIETGALLDLLVGIFVMGIVINHISREFSSIDTSRLQALREE